MTPCLAAVQQDVTNTWQADNALISGNSVSLVDWGDKLEARDVDTMQRAVRVETSLYETVASPMTQYPMCYVSGQGIDEVWGMQVVADASAPLGYAPVSLESTDAMVYTDGARLTIQRIVPDRTYAWDPIQHMWIGSGADVPVFNSAVHERTADGPGAYGAEVSVSGKVVFGFNWMTQGLPEGEYRLTFSLDDATGDFPGSGTNLAQAALLVSEETDETVVPTVAEEGDDGSEPAGNNAVINGVLDLTYLDLGFGTRTDPIPPVDPVTPPVTDVGTSTPGSPAAPAAVVLPQGPSGSVTTGPEQPISVSVPAAATTRQQQTARLRAPANGTYPVGTVLVLAKKPVKTSAGVTVRWRATTQSREECRVRVMDGKATATLLKPGVCRVVAWAPAPSVNYAPFRAERAYRVVSIG